MNSCFSKFQSIAVSVSQASAFPSGQPRDFRAFRVKGLPRNRRLQTTTSARARFIGNPRNAPSFRRVPQAPGKPEEISIVSRSLALLSLLFPNIVARVPRSRSIAECINPGWVKGFVCAPPARGANRYAAPFPPAVLRSARWRCSCSCGRSCGSSVDDAFCGRSGRYAVMRIVAGTPPPPSLLRSATNTSRGSRCHVRRTANIGATFS